MIFEIGKGILVGLVASITVGPVAVLCAQRALSRNRISAFVSGMGVVCADTIMAILAYFLYSMIFTKIEEYKSILGVIGGIIVIIFGVYILRKNPVQSLRKSRASKNTLGQDFMSVFGLTISNFVVALPYIFAFFAMFRAASGDEFDELSRGILILLGFFIGSFAWWTTLTMSLSFVRKKIRPRHFLWLDRIAGSIIVLLGIYTILSTFVDVIAI